MVDVTDCEETAPGTAVAVTVRSTEVEVAVVGVAVVVEVAVLVEVAPATVAEVFDAVPVVAAVVVPDDDLPATAMHPVRTTIPATLTEPAILRARCAGWGRRRRGAGGGAVRMLTPFVET